MVSNKKGTVVCLDVRTTSQLGEMKSCGMVFVAGQYNFHFVLFCLNMIVARALLCLPILWSWGHIYKDLTTL
jgi:hypothetical protein